MSNDEQVKRLLRPAAEAIKDVLPPGWGLALFVFPLEGREGNFHYVATAKRETLLPILKGFVERHEADICDRCKQPKAKHWTKDSDPGTLICPCRLIDTFLPMGDHAEDREGEKPL